MKLRLVKRTAEELTYKIPVCSYLSGALIRGIRNPARKRLVFHFPKPKDVPKEGLRFADIPNRYVVVITYRAAPGEVKQLGRFYGRPKVRLVIPATTKELEKLDKQTYSRHFKRPFKNVLLPSQEEADRYFYSHLLPNANAVLIMKGEKLVGLYSLLRVKQGGKLCQVVPWSYISRDLTDRERQDAHFQISNWLKRSLNGLPLSGGVHSVNIPAQKFAIKLGLKPVSISVEDRCQK